MEQKNEASYYIVIPGKVRFDKRLSAESKLLFGEIAAKCNLKGFCWATNGFFSDIIGCNVRSVQRYIKELEDAGHITMHFEKTVNGTDRKIFLSSLEKFKATDLSPETPQDPSGVTNLTPLNDAAVMGGGDTTVTHITLTSLKIKENIPNSFPGGKGGDKTDTTKKTGKKKDKPKTLLENFTEIYYDWHKKNNDGLPPKIDGASQNAAKSLIGYFKTIVRAKAEKESNILDDQQLEALVLESWKYVLNNWDKLEPFLQDKTRLIDINSRIQDILKQVKNATNRKPFEGNKPGTGKSRGAQQLANSLFADFSANGQGTGNGDPQI